MYGKMQESGLPEIIPLILGSYLGPVSYIFTSWVSSGLPSLHWRGTIADDYEILVN